MKLHVIRVDMKETIFLLKSITTNIVHLVVENIIVAIEIAPNLLR